MFGIFSFVLATVTSLTFLLLVIPALVLYLWHINRAMLSVPESVTKATPHRWTKQDIQEAFERVRRHPIDFTPHLPTKQERRYIVVGASGLVGGYIVLHLLQRGESPESIRMLDFVPPKRADMLRGKAAQVPFCRVDITSEESVRAAFAEPWPESVAQLPITVLHIAAIINFTDRSRSQLHKVNAVNLTGTANVMSASKKAGANVFISTSSASVALVPPKWWIWPWEKYPKNFAQFVNEDDGPKPMRDHYQYFGNYAVSKSHAEKLIMEANSSTFKTGTIRPGNGIYGSRYDYTLGTYLNRGDVPTWIPNIVQNFVNAENISLGHLDLERALLTPGNSAGGRAFVITDPNPAISFMDIYNLLSQLSVTPFKIQVVSPVIMLLLSYAIELYTLSKVFFPLIDRLLPDLPADLTMLQPTLFNVSNIHVVASDVTAQKSIAEGGIGYKGAHTTLDGMCMQVKLWNDEHQDQNPQEHVDAQLKNEIRNVGAVPAAVNL